MPNVGPISLVSCLKTVYAFESSKSRRNQGSECFLVEGNVYVGIVESERIVVCCSKECSIIVYRFVLVPENSWSRFEQNFVMGQLPQ